MTDTQTHRQTHRQTLGVLKSLDRMISGLKSKSHNIYNKNPLHLQSLQRRLRFKMIWWCWRIYIHTCDNGGKEWEEDVCAVLDDDILVVDDHGAVKTTENAEKSSACHLDNRTYSSYPQINWKQKKICPIKWVSHF